MRNKIRCCWCGWYGEVRDLDLGESDEPKYCPVCGHEEFDNRYFNNFVSAIFLKPTWNRETNCENCEF